MERNGGAAELSRLQVDQYGRIANWPSEFFGDAMGEVERQTRRMLERMAERGQTWRERKSGATR